MHKIIVLYPQPENPKAFMEHYETRHLALVKQLPNLLEFSFGAIEPSGPQTPEHFLVFEALFANRELMTAALASKEGQAIVEDVPNYSPGGFQLLHFEVINNTN